MGFLNLYRISSNSKHKAERNPEEGLNEDEDVQMEKARVKEALTCQSCEEVSRYLLQENKELLKFVSVDDQMWASFWLKTAPVT